MAQARGGMLEEGPGKADPDDDAVPAPRMADETLISVRPARRRRQPPGKEDRAAGGEAGARHPVPDRNQHPRPPATHAEMGRHRARRNAGKYVTPATGTFAG